MSRSRYSLLGNVHSYNAQRCWEFGLNPDVEELKQYHEQAKSRACLHPKLTVRERDDGMGVLVCPDCDLSDPDFREKARRTGLPRP